MFEQFISEAALILSGFTAIFKFRLILQLAGYFTSVTIPLEYGTAVSTEPDVSIAKCWLHGHTSLQPILLVFFCFFLFLFFFFFCFFLASTYVTIK